MARACARFLGAARARRHYSGYGTDGPGGRVKVFASIQAVLRRARSSAIRRYSVISAFQQQQKRAFAWRDAPSVLYTFCLAMSAVTLILWAAVSACLREPVPSVFIVARALATLPARACI